MKKSGDDSVITLGHLAISQQGKKYVNECLDNNRLSRGNFTVKFEQDFAKLHGCAHGVFCNSGTSALQIALASLKEHHRFDYEDGDEILVPAITFIATSNVVLQNSLKPVFVDVDPITFNMDPEKIASKITPRTRAIIPVHLFGLPANMPRIMMIAKHWGLDVIEDSCETMFAGIDGRSVGTFGDMACFSTYVAHLIVGGVGGLVTTNAPAYDELCRSFMAHGRDSIYTSIDDDDKISKDMIERRYKFDRVGYSYRCTEIEAAIALSELERWEENLSTRRNNATTLTALLSPFADKLQLPIVPQGYDHSYMMYPFVCKDGVDRDALLLHMEQRGIETRFMFPLLSQPVYRKLFPGMAGKYPVASRLEKQGAFIGMHQGLTDEDMFFIADTIREGLCAQ
jgi:CDP-6-deoxy-D-xylo-4-hexulose-3-dehydrase